MSSCNFASPCSHGFCSNGGCWKGKTGKRGCKDDEDCEGFCSLQNPKNVCVQCTSHAHCRPGACSSKKVCGDCTTSVQCNDFKLDMGGKSYDTKCISADKSIVLTNKNQGGSSSDNSGLECRIPKLKKDDVCGWNVTGQESNNGGCQDELECVFKDVKDGYMQKKICEKSEFEAVNKKDLPYACKCRRTLQVGEDCSKDKEEFCDETLFCSNGESKCMASTGGPCEKHEDCSYYWGDPVIGRSGDFCCPSTKKCFNNYAWQQKIETYHAMLGKREIQPSEGCPCGPDSPACSPHISFCSGEWKVCKDRKIKNRCMLKHKPGDQNITLWANLWGSCCESHEECASGFCGKKKDGKPYRECEDANTG